MARVWSATIAGMSLVWSIACSSPTPPAGPAGSAAAHSGHGAAADSGDARTTLLGNLGKYLPPDSNHERRGAAVLR